MCEIIVGPLQMYRNCIINYHENLTLDIILQPPPRKQKKERLNKSNNTGQDVQDNSESANNLSTQNPRGHHFLCQDWHGNSVKA